MTTQSPTRRLNPFLFPSETDFRFLLLIAAVLGASLFVYRSLANAFWRAEFGQMVLKCGFDKACFDPFERKQALFIAGGLLVVLFVALVIYWGTPGRIIKRRHLSALTSEDEPEMLLYLHTLCQQMGLRHPPAFLLDPINPTVSGLAFGRRGQYYVVLTGGLISYYYTDRSAFQAVVLHELAHLKNADVDKTYFTMAIWYAFLAVAILPFALSLVVEIVRFGASEAVLLRELTWRAAVLAVLVYGVRNSVLRIREFYADARAMIQVGAPEPLGRLLVKLSPTPSRWQPFGPVHPPPAQRQQRLLDSLSFFRIGFWEALSTGLAITTAVYNTIFWLTILLPAQTEWVAYPLALLLFAPLAVGVVGSGVWRSVFAAITLGRSAQPVIWISVGLGMGLVLGRKLSFDAAIQALSPNEQWLAALTSDLFWGVLLTMMVYLFLRWLKASATPWLATVTAPRRLAQVTIAGFITSAVILSWWLGGLLQATEKSYTKVVYLAYTVPDALTSSWQDFFSGYVLSWPLGVLVTGLLCAFPLVGWWARRRKNALAVPWAFLEV